MNISKKLKKIEKRIADKECTGQLITAWANFISDTENCDLSKWQARIDELDQSIRDEILRQTNEYKERFGSVV